MSLPDPRERPTLSMPEAGEVLGLGRSASYTSDVLNAIAIQTSPDRKVVPTARLLQLLGVEDHHGAAPPAEALMATAFELGAAVDEATRVLRHLLEAVAAAKTVATLLAGSNSDPSGGRTLTSTNSEAGPGSPANANPTAVGGPHHDGIPLRAV